MANVIFGTNFSSIRETVVFNSDKNNVWEQAGIFAGDLTVTGYGIYKAAIGIPRAIVGGGKIVAGIVGGAIFAPVTGASSELVGGALALVGVKEFAVGGALTASGAMNIINSGKHLGDDWNAVKSAGVAQKIQKQGQQTFDNFDISNAYVKPKHLSTTKGDGSKFLGDTKMEAEAILQDALDNGKIISITDDGISAQGNQKFAYTIDAGKAVGTKGENLIKIILSEDGGMLSAYPVK